MSEDFRKKKLKEDEQSLWEQIGREKSQPSRWDSFKKRIIGEKTAAEIAEEEAEKLKKKNNGI